MWANSLHIQHMLIVSDYSFCPITKVVFCIYMLCQLDSLYQTLQEAVPDMHSSSPPILQVKHFICSLMILYTHTHTHTHITWCPAYQYQSGCWQCPRKHISKNPDLEPTDTVPPSFSTCEHLWNSQFWFITTLDILRQNGVNREWHYIGVWQYLVLTSVLKFAVAKIA